MKRRLTGLAAASCILVALGFLAASLPLRPARGASLIEAPKFSVQVARGGVGTLGQACVVNGRRIVARSSGEATEINGRLIPED